MSEDNRIEIQDGYYDARPTFCGLTVSKNGHDQFAIECAIEVPLQDGTTRTVHLTKFNGLSTEPLPAGGSQLEFTMGDADRCGCNVDGDIREWMVDQNRKVRVKIVNDEYGPKLKSIFDESSSGGLIRKQAMDDGRKAVVAESLNARIKAMRAKQAAQGNTKSAPRPASKPAANGPPNDWNTPSPASDDIPF
jgi:hypothetical protein